MMGNLRSEIRKLLTVRSTYVIFGLCLVLEGIFAFYGSGLKAKPADLQNPHYLANQATSAITILGVLIALVGVLLVTHEYRYNTILHTLTASKNRTRVIIAKIATISLFAVIASAVLALLSPLLTDIGIHVKGLELVSQSMPYGDILWRSVYTGWGFSMLALLLAVIIRSQPGAIAALFLIPGTVEQLLGLLLKDKQVYLPFDSLGAVIEHNDHLSYGHAALVALAYIAVGWLIAWALFLRRDAN